jgi:hypothetical protein
MIDEEDEEKSWASILIPLMLAVPLTLWRGYVFCKLWGWFLLRHGAPPIALIEGIGIWLTVAFVTAKYDGKKDLRPEEKWWAVEIVRFLIPAFFWVSGWIYQHFL